MFGSRTKKSVKDVYRTNDGRGYFEFNFVEESGGTWRADIEKQPSYGSFPSSLHSSHRLSSSSAATGHKICYASVPRSLRDAQKWAEAWAEATWTIVNGGPRPPHFK